MSSLKVLVSSNLDDKQISAKEEGRLCYFVQFLC